MSNSYYNVKYDCNGRNSTLCDEHGCKGHELILGVHHTSDTVSVMCEDSQRVEYYSDEEFLALISAINEAYPGRLNGRYYMVYRQTPTGKIYMSFDTHPVEGWEFWSWVTGIEQAIKFYDRRSAELMSAECDDCLIGEHDQVRPAHSNLDFGVHVEYDNGTIYQFSCLCQGHHLVPEKPCYEYVYKYGIMSVAPGPARMYAEAVLLCKGWGRGADGMWYCKECYEKLAERAK